MKSKGVRFDEVYDLFAVRIILDVPHDDEKIEMLEGVFCSY
ncbi:MAG: hypothetical protein U5L09_04890 [Bacteroidales bacterium]|nr:hypothetical protein [Bacteroidales bacterium]